MTGQDTEAPTPTENLARLLVTERPAMPQGNSPSISTAPPEDDSDFETDDEDVYGPIRSPGHKASASLFNTIPFLHDTLQSPSSLAQDRVAEECRKHMSDQARESANLNRNGTPRLLRQKHTRYLHETLVNRYDAQYQAMDASRPWMLYWALAGLAHLGEDISGYRQRTIDTLAPMQNLTGGFGGGHGQTSHVAASYAATLALALVDGLEVVNRKTMWQWLGGLKQIDGGFAMADGGEIDVRGAYCSLTIVSLLNLPLMLPKGSPSRELSSLELFTDKVGEWIGECQTFEGGIGAAPGNEAHGAYAFCGLACLCILDAPHRSIPRYLDMDRLIAWLSARQSAPEGAFSGRTNKLVDACYSHWVGGCWSLIEAALAGTEAGTTFGGAPLWSREALTKYTLCCSQTKNGGLRDKPSTRRDGYHTCYSLAGLSAAQNVWRYEGEIGPDWAQSGVVGPAYAWRAYMATRSERKVWSLDEQDRVGFVHPVFVMPPEVVARTQQQMTSVIGF